MTQYYFNRYISDHRSVAEVHHITCVESESIKIKQILDYYLSISNYRIEDCVIQMPKVFSSPRWDVRVGCIRILSIE